MRFVVLLYLALAAAELTEVNDLLGVVEIESDHDNDLLGPVAIKAARIDDAKPSPPTYRQLRNLAAAHHHPLVVGVGCTVPKGDWIAYEIKVFPWGSWDRRTMIVSRGDGTELWWVADLPPDATAADIIRALGAYRKPPASRGPSPAGAPVKKWNPYDRKENPQNLPLRQMQSSAPRQAIAGRDGSC